MGGHRSLNRAVRRGARRPNCRCRAARGQKTSSLSQVGCESTRTFPTRRICAQRPFLVDVVVARPAWAVDSVRRPAAGPNPVPRAGGGDCATVGRIMRAPFRVVCYASSAPRNRTRSERHCGELVGNRSLSITPLPSPITTTAHCFFFFLSSFNVSSLRLPHEPAFANFGRFLASISYLY